MTAPYPAPLEAGYALRRATVFDLRAVYRLERLIFPRDAYPYADLFLLFVLPGMLNQKIVAPDGSHHAIFGAGGGKRLAALTGAPLLGAIPIEAAVSSGGDDGKPVVLATPDSPAARALRAVAEMRALLAQPLKR